MFSKTAGSLGTLHHRVALPIAATVGALLLCNVIFSHPAKAQEIPLPATAHPALVSTVPGASSDMPDPDRTLSLDYAQQGKAILMYSRVGSYGLGNRIAVTVSLTNISHLANQMVELIVPPGKMGTALDGPYHRIVSPGLVVHRGDSTLDFTALNVSFSAAEAEAGIAKEENSALFLPQDAAARKTVAENMMETRHHPGRVLSKGPWMVFEAGDKQEQAVDLTPFIEAAQYDKDAQTVTLYLEPDLLNDTRIRLHGRSVPRIHIGDQLLVGLHLLLALQPCDFRLLAATTPPLKNHLPVSSFQSAAYSQSAALAETIPVASQSPPVTVYEPQTLWHGQSKQQDHLKTDLPRPLALTDVTTGDSGVLHGGKRNVVQATLTLSDQLSKRHDSFYVRGKQIISSATDDLKGQLEIKTGYEHPFAPSYALLYGEGGVKTSETLTNRSLNLEDGARCSLFRLTDDAPQKLDTISNHSLLQLGLIFQRPFRRDARVTSSNDSLTGFKGSLSTKILPLLPGYPLELSAVGWYLPLSHGRGGYRGLKATAGRLELAIPIYYTGDKAVRIKYTAGTNEASGYQFDKGQVVVSLSPN